MFDLFKSDYAPIENFSNIDFERKFKNNNVDRVVYKDPYSDERNNVDKKELANEYIPPEKKPEPGTSRIEPVNTKVSKKEATEVMVKDIINETDEIYNVEKFGKDLVCTCGVDVKNASNITQEVNKKAIMLDKIVSNLKKNQRECVLNKINKLKLSQFPSSSKEESSVDELLEDALDVVKAEAEPEPTKNKDIKVINTSKDARSTNRQVEEEQGDIYNISHDIFSNEMIIIAVIIAIVILCMN